MKQHFPLRRSTLDKLSWGLCAFFCLFLMVESSLTRICMVLCAVLVCPLFRKKARLPAALWVPAVAILFVAGCLASPPAEAERDGAAPAIIEAVSDASDSGTTPASESVPEGQLGGAPGSDSGTTSAEDVTTATAPGEYLSAGITVYVTESGNRYHRSNCRHLNKSKLKLRLRDALEQGYEPCGTCQPPLRE